MKDIEIKNKSMCFVHMLEFPTERRALPTSSWDISSHKLEAIYLLSAQSLIVITQFSIFPESWITMLFMMYA